jgi:hypothetical protein
MTEAKGPPCYAEPMHCLDEKLQADVITIPLHVFLNPSDLKERGDRNRDLGEKELAPNQVRDGQQPMGEQVQAPGADILDPPPDDPLSFPGKSQVGKFLGDQLAVQRIAWVLSPLPVSH